MWRLKKIVLVGIMVISLPLFAFAQNTAQELGKMIVEAKNTKNKDLIEKLLHPECIKYFREHDISTFNAKIETTLKKSVPDKYEVEVSVLSDSEWFNKNYNSESKKLDMGFQYAVFPVTPTHQLSIFNVEEENTRDLILGDYAAEYNGTWFIVWPIQEIRKK